jgi:hypothetical protein
VEDQPRSLELIMQEVSQCQTTWSQLFQELQGLAKDQIVIPENSQLLLQ